MTNSLVYYPNKILRTKATNINNITPEIKQFANFMLNVMYNSAGIGLAANQVGSGLNMLVLDLQEDDIKKPMVCINPVITSYSAETSEMEEGCLSLPGIKGIVTRPKQIQIQFLDLEGVKHNITATDLLAVCLQHEVDHLNGKIFLDRMSAVDKSKLLREYLALNNTNSND